ncbi:MAG: hypothetical protein A2020_06250 [Lentisphaerae bacterium GWF2_45_14]|nr:MAG: hypothetical protein A2020_06250 [Lentisphaerae bacterium GWF2_45_14]
MLNVLLVSSKYMPEYSGSGFRAHNQYKRLCEKYPEISLKVLCGSETFNNIEDYEYDGLKVSRIAAKSLSLPGGGIMRRLALLRNFQKEVSKVHSYLKNLTPQPDVIHIFGKNYVTSAVIDFASKRNIPTIIELCNEMDSPYHFVPFPHRLWMETKFPPRSHIVAISEHLRDISLRGGVSGEKIWCRPNPVDEKKFFPVDEDTKMTMRKELTKFSGDYKLVTYIAKYKKTKNQEFLVDVVKALPEEYKLYLGGPIVDSGPKAKEDVAFYEKIVRRVKDEGLEQRVQVECGFVKNIDKFYQMADVYGFPTTYEGLGTPMLESIACGTPVIGVLIPGITDVWIKDGENGFVAAKSAEDFAGKIVEAAGFSKEKRKNESLKILNIAGTNVIDMEYYALLRKMAESR